MSRETGSTTCAVRQHALQAMRSVVPKGSMHAAGCHPQPCRGTLTAMLILASAGKGHVSDCLVSTSVSQICTLNIVGLIF